MHWRRRCQPGNLGLDILFLDALLRTCADQPVECQTGLARDAAGYRGGARARVGLWV
jgi:hypothetical protein